MWEWIVLRVLGKSFDEAFEYGKQPAKRLLTMLLPKPDLNTLQLQINTHFKNEIELFCFNQHEPIISIMGKQKLTAPQKKAASAHRKALKSMGRPNDPHAVLTDKPLWKADPVTLRVNTLDFSEVCALRDEGLKPPIISAGAVMICSETEELILHRRAADIGYYSNGLHILGGAYIPTAAGGVDPDRSGLRSTVVRELHEESQASISLHRMPPMVLAQEISTGFIQLVLLGLSISASDIDKLSGNWEGTPERIPFRNLASVLQDPTWVPTGKAHVLTWLGLGAPNSKSGQKFGALKAKDLFKSVISA